MDGDPELDVTLSDGRASVTYQIAPVDGAVEAWAILEPFGPVTVVMGRAAAVEARSRLDRVIAARLAAGWVPVDVGLAGAPLGPATPLPADLVLQISHGLEALERHRAALRAADPSGQLWAACVTWLRQARRFGVGAARAWVARAERERRLAELAEQAGDVPAAILHYRAALAAHPRVGVRRRLAQLARHWPTPTDGHPPDRGRNAADVPHAVSRCRAAASSPATPTATPRIMAGRRACVGSSRTRSDEEQTTMTKKRRSKVQLVCRIDPALNEKVRARAARAGQTLTTFVARALTKMVAGQPVTPKVR
jgi:hypothetical protein